MHQLPFIDLVYLGQKLLQSEVISQRLSKVMVTNSQRIPLLKDLPHFGEVAGHLGYVIWQVVWN
jgi:hypothetical protein